MERMINVFSTEKIFTIQNFGEGKYYNYVRCIDNDNIVYDFKVEDESKLIFAKKQISYFSVKVSGDIDAARVKYTSKGELLPIGEGNNTTLFCNLVNQIGISTSAKVVGRTNTMNNIGSEGQVEIWGDETPQTTFSEFDPNDEDMMNALAASKTAITVSPEGNLSIGRGTNALSFSDKGNMSVDSQTITNTCQNSDQAGGLIHRWSLRNYFLTMVNAVAFMPMPDIVNIVKMVAIGKFTKTLIGKKAKYEYYQTNSGRM